MSPNGLTCRAAAAGVPAAQQGRHRGRLPAASPPRVEPGGTWPKRQAVGNFGRGMPPPDWPTPAGRGVASVARARQAGGRDGSGGSLSGRTPRSPARSGGWGSNAASAWCGSRPPARSLGDPSEALAPAWAVSRDGCPIGRLRLYPAGMSRSLAAPAGSVKRPAPSVSGIQLPESGAGAGRACHAFAS